MKKKYLDFTKVHYFQRRRYLPKMTLKFTRGAAYKSDGGEGEGGEGAEGGEGDPGDSSEVKAIKAIGKQVEQFKTLLGEKAKAEDFATLKTQLEALQKDINTMKAEDISKAIEAINASNEKIHKQIVELQEENQRQKEESASGGSGKVKSLVATKDVEAFVKSTFEDGRKTHNPAKIEIKAAETMGVANFYEGGADTVIDAFTGRMVDPTLYQRKRKRNLILDNFVIRTINVPKLIFLVKVEVGDSESVSGDPGGAEWIISSEAKPMRSFRVTTGEAEAKKVAIFGTVEDKLLRDVASLENWIREDFMDEMREKINDGLLNNDIAVNPKAPQGMKTDAILFTATEAFDGTISDANYIDAIVAVLALMSDNREEAGKVFVTSDVFYAILVLKDSNARYQNNALIYTNNLGQLFIAGTEIVKADKEDVPATHVLVTAADLGFKMYAYGPMVFERGLNGEDFRYDRTSYRGYQEFLTYLPTHRENTVLYDTWDNILAAISAPAS